MKCEQILEVCRDTGAERECGMPAEFRWKGLATPICSGCLEELVIDGTATRSEFEAIPSASEDPTP